MAGQSHMRIERIQDALIAAQLRHNIYAATTKIRPEKTLVSAPPE